MEAVIPGNTKNQFNLAAQSARQAGSTFKSFVLAAAIEQGADPDSTYYTSAPYTCTSGPWCEGDYAAGKPWQVATYGHTYSGSMSVTSATLRSDNTVYAQLTLDVGPDYVWRMAKRLGINLTQKPVASIGLGPLGVSPLEMAAAYATFASGGIYAKPTGDHEGRAPERQGRQALGQAATPSARSRRASRGRSTRCSAQNALYGTGAGSGDGDPPDGGQDRHDRGPRRRLVRRLHARPLDGRLDGLSVGRDPDALRARPGRRGLDLPGADLALVHGAPPSGTGRCGSSSSPTTRSPTGRSRSTTTATRRTSRPTSSSTTTTEDEEDDGDRDAAAAAAAGRRADAEAGAERAARRRPRRRRRRRPAPKPAD